MTVVSSENRVYWENLQKRRKIQVLDSRDSALLISRDLPAAKKRTAVSKVKAALPVEKKCGSLLLERLQKVDEKKNPMNLLGKRPRESAAETKKEQEDEELRKRRRLHEDQLRKRRLEEIKKQKETDESRKQKLEAEKLKKQEDDKREREQARAAARKSLEDMEMKAKEKVIDHYKIMKDFAKIINYAPSEFNYFYP